MGQRAPGPSGSSILLSEFACEEAKSIFPCHPYQHSCGPACTLLPCSHKCLQRKSVPPAWYWLRQWCLLGASFRFVSSCCLQQLTNRRPKSGEIVPFGHKLPLLPRPCGACLLDICADADTALRSRPPLPNIQAGGINPDWAAVPGSALYPAPMLCQ